MSKFENVDDLIPLFSSLESLYIKLAQLEIDGIKDGQEITSCIESIQLVISVIMKKMPSIADFEFDSYKEYLMRKYNIAPFDVSNLDEFILNNNNFLKRLINQFYYRSKRFGIDLDESFTPIFDIIAREDPDSSIRAENTLLLTNNISDTFDILLQRILFEYILEEIDKTTSKHIKDQLIRIKYHLIFLYPELEIAYIFTSHPKTDNLSKCFLNNVKRLNSDYESFKYIYIDYLYDCIVELFESIANLDDEFFNNEKNRIIVLIRVILIKTFTSLNIDLNTDRKLKEVENELLNKTKSEEAKRYLLQSFSLSTNLNIPKMVDL